MERQRLIAAYFRIFWTSMGKHHISANADIRDFTLKKKKLYLFTKFFIYQQRKPHLVDYTCINPKGKIFSRSDAHIFKLLSRE